MVTEENFKWKIVQRWQEFRIEALVNFLRLSCIILFYLIELINFHGLKLGPIEINKVVDLSFHKLISALALLWGAISIGIFLFLRERIFPSLFKYLTTGLDLIFLTLILFLADGARSPLVVCYFLIIILSSIRMNLFLVRFSTLGALTGYWLLNVNVLSHHLPPPPFYHSLIFSSALLLTGIFLGQLTRQIRSVSEEYRSRLSK
jgi:hypothetical protein